MTQTATTSYNEEDTQTEIVNFETTGVQANVINTTIATNTNLDFLEEIEA